MLVVLWKLDGWKFPVGPSRELPSQATPAVASTLLSCAAGTLPAYPGLTNIKIYVQPGNPGLCGGVSEREARLGGRSHVMEGVFLALGFPFLHSWRDSWQAGLRGGAVLVRLTTSFRPCALYLASELCPLTTAD